MLNLAIATLATVILICCVFTQLAFGEMDDEWEWQDRRIESIERKRQQRDTLS